MSPRGHPHTCRRPAARQPGGGPSTAAIHIVGTSVAGFTPFDESNRSRPPKLCRKTPTTPSVPRATSETSCSNQNRHPRYDRNHPHRPDRTVMRAENDASDSETVR